MKILFALLLSLFLLACNPFPKQENQTLPTHPKVYNGVLTNGLHYTIYPNTTPKNRAELRLVFKIGALEESEQQRGLAHFIEHMAFNGTKHFKSNDVVSFMESIGMRFGSHVNASTGYEQTLYKLSIPTDKPKILDQTFSILRDWSDGIVFDEAEIERERGVIIEEWRKRKSVRSRVNDQIRDVIFEGSMYKERKPIGLVEVLKTAPRSELIAFYKQWYRPEFASLIVVGDINVSQIEALIEKKFSSFKASAPFKERTKRTIPARTKTTTLIIDDKELTRASLDLDFISPKREIITQKAYRENLIEQLTFSILNKRVSRFDETPNPPFLRAFAHISQFTQSKLSHNVGMEFIAHDFNSSFYALIDELNSLRTYGFLESELHREKSKLKKQLSTRSKEANNYTHHHYTAGILRHHLYNTPFLSHQQNEQLVNMILPTITIKDLEQSLKTILNNPDLLITLTLPSSQKAFIPSPLTLTQQWNQSHFISTYRYTEPKKEPLRICNPQRGTILTKKENHSLGITQYLLSNGIRVILKPTDFKDDEIMMYAFNRDGLNTIDDEHYLSAKLYATLHAKSGVANFTHRQLLKHDANTSFSLQPYLGEIQSGYSGKCNNSELEAFFQRLHLMITEPRLDEVVLQNSKDKISHSLEERHNSPKTRFRDELQHFLYDSPRKRYWSDESLNEVTLTRLDDVINHYTKLSDQSAFVFVGNITIDTFETFLKHYIASLPTSKVSSQKSKRFSINTTQNQFIKAYNSEPRSEVTLIYHQLLPYEREEYLNLLALTQLINIKLREEIREKSSAVYSIRLHSRHDRLPEEKFVGEINFSCDPKRVDEIIAKIDTIIQNVQRKHSDQKNINAIKKMRHATYEDKIQSNQHWLNALSKKSFYADDLNLLSQYTDWIDTITAIKLQKSAKHYFASAHKLKIILNPKDNNESR